MAAPTVERKLLEEITRDSDGEHAPQLIELLYRIGGPDNPKTDNEMRFLVTQTEEFDRFYRNYLKQFDDPEVTSEAPS